MEFGPALRGDHIRSVRDEHRELGGLLVALCELPNARIGELERLGERVGGEREGERSVLREPAQKEVKEDLAIGLAKNHPAKVRRDLLQKERSILFEIRDIAVMGEGIAAVLKGVAVQHADLAVS